MPEISSKLTPTTQSQITPNPVLNYSDTNNHNDEIPLEKNNKRIYYVGLILLILAFATTIGVFYLRSKTEIIGEEKVEEEVAQIEEPALEPEPVPEEPKEEIKKSEISLEILNASGVPGAAQQIADKFENLGYKIAKVGNADPTQGNKVYINPDYSGKLDNLLSDLSKELDINQSNGDLENSSAYAQIILGS